ncbi:hypothetical protein M2321_002682 [Rhodoblastus acidophilus]|nr:oxidoreductase [Rhodoblastus acidophilus]MCW2275099.1 hypothetical protein [Rhodoblastus acidophilus]
MRRAELGFQMPTVEAILKTYKRDEEERTYLGASIIGKECERQLWYGFRWACQPEDFDGRMLRLFATGHREEARMIEDLRASGVQVWDRGEDGKQIGFSDLGGHFKGHMDSVLLGVKEAPKTPHVGEFKTHNLDSFKKLKRDAVEVAKFEHFAQMQTYMHEEGLTRALYLAHCKDTDELYAERIEYDGLCALTLLAKAERIITSDRAPERAHEHVTSRAAYACDWCPALRVCHHGGWARRNCRTCLHATPEMDGDGRWSCAYHKCDLTAKDQRAGCAQHIFLPDLVPGEQIDADMDANTVTYLVGGKRFVDGGCK